MKQQRTDRRKETGKERGRSARPAAYSYWNRHVVGPENSVAITASGDASSLRASDDRTQHGGAVRHSPFLVIGGTRLPPGSGTVCLLPAEGVVLPPRAVFTNGEKWMVSPAGGTVESERVMGAFPAAAAAAAVCLA